MVMKITFEDISKRAFEIWEREGKPEGRGQDHWFQAEAELRRETKKDQKERKHQHAKTF